MLTINELYDLSHSLAGDYLKQFTYPWEALAGISDLILEIDERVLRLACCEIARKLDALPGVDEARRMG